MKAPTTLLDPKHLDLTILCVKCDKPLWRMKILGQYSAQYEPYDGVPTFSERILKCPHCQQHFYTKTSAGLQQYKMLDHASGKTIWV